MEADMNDDGTSHPLQKLDCPDCKKPMRVLALMPTSNGLHDLAYKCEACGKIVGLVHKPEDR